MPLPPRFLTVNLGRHPQDMVGMLTMTVPFHKVVFLVRRAGHRVLVDGISMKLCASSVEKVSSFTVLCSSVDIVPTDGHYANHCPNRNVPGNRGGMDRTTQRKFDDE